METDFSKLLLDETPDAIVATTTEGSGAVLEQGLPREIEACLGEPRKGLTMATILIVDDRASNRQLLTTLLGRGGHRLLEAANGAEALDLVRAERPDLVITDILMPNMDGCEFVQHLRSDPELAATPVIFITATYRAREARTLAQSCGVEIVLAKPCEPQEILAAVNRALGVEVPASDSAAAKQAVAEADALRQIEDPGRRYIKDLQAVKLDFDEVIDHSAKLIAERDLARGLSKKLSANVDSLQRVMSRLSAVIEVGMEMEAERDPAKLIQLLFAAACDIIDSKYAAVGVLDEQEQAFRHVYAKGIEPRIFQTGDERRTGLLETLLSGHRAIRTRSLDSETEGLPAGHPPVLNILAVPIRSADRVYGWIYFADKTGAPEFSVEDERLANIIATKLALRHENLCFYDVIQRHAAKLQVEAAERKRAQEALRASETRFRGLTELSSDWYFEWDAELSIRYLSQRDGRLSGIAAERALGRKLWDTNVTPLNFTWEQVWADLEARKPFREIEYLRIGDDGNRCYVALSGEPVFDEAGAFTGYRGVGKNITFRKQAEDKVKALNRVYAVLSGINALIVRVSDRDELFEGACRIAVEAGKFRMSWIGLVERNAMKIVPVASAGANPEYMTFIKDQLSLAEDTPMGDTLVVRALREKKAFFSNDTQDDPRIRFKKEHAERGTRSIAVLPLLVADEAVGVLALHTEEAGFFDEAELKLLTELAGDIAFAVDHIEKAEKLNYLAFYDPLTELPNRTLFHDRLSHSLHARGGEAPFIAVVLLDLERFRHVNETLGRQAGDELLRGVGERLLRANDTAARIGSDMFALTLRGARTAEEVNRAVDAIARACFHAPFALRGEELSVSCRIGVALHPADGADAVALLHNAEAALRRSKRSGDRIVFYASEMNARVAEALAMENKLRRALERQEFVLHYQPKVNLADGRVTGVEALIRWQDPDEKGLVPPDRFIPILEETGLIVEVGLWVIGRALTDFGVWAAKGLAVTRVAVNVSAIQLQREDFVDRVIDAVQHSGDAAGWLELEITESLLMRDVEASKRKLSILRGLGIDVSMDDFGTGHSSLSYMARLPVDTVKIDRSFVNGMVGNAEDASIVGGIIALVHSLGKEVIAEGVETSEQAQRLAVLGCDEAQGYHYSRPVPAAQIEALMRSGGTLPALPSAWRER